MSFAIVSSLGRREQAIDKLKAIKRAIEIEIFCVRMLPPRLSWFI
jgi:hypothetical protein